MVHVPRLEIKPQTFSEITEKFVLFFLIMFFYFGLGYVELLEMNCFIFGSNIFFRRFYDYDLFSKHHW